MAKNRVLVKLDQSVGRMGDVEGLFVCTEDEYKALIGDTAYFGEVLGKHSQVTVTLNASNLTVLSRDQEKIAWLEGLVIGKTEPAVETTTVSGLNPLHYINRED